MYLPEYKTIIFSHSSIRRTQGGPVTAHKFKHVSGYVQSDTKKRELLKNPIKIEEIQEKKFIDRN